MKKGSCELFVLEGWNEITRFLQTGLHLDDGVRAKRRVSDEEVNRTPTCLAMARVLPPRSSGRCVRKHNRKVVRSADVRDAINPVHLLYVTGR